MSVLLVSHVCVRLAHRVVSLVTLRKELVALLVGADEAEAEEEDDNDFGGARGHADDGAGTVDGCFGGDEAVGADDVACGDAEEDGWRVSWARQGEVVSGDGVKGDEGSPAVVKTFLVVPPTLPETSERASTKTALDDPVRSADQPSPYRCQPKRLTVSDQARSSAGGERHQSEAKYSEAGDAGHKVGSDVVRVGEVRDVDGDQAGDQLRTGPEDEKIRTS